MRTAIYDVVGIAMALAIALVAVLNVIKFRSAGGKWLDRAAIKWLLVAVLSSILSPCLYYYEAPIPITLADAYLLRVRVAGWTFVLMIYMGTAGLFLGAILSLLSPRKKSTT